MAWGQIAALLGRLRGGSGADRVAACNPGRRDRGNPRAKTILLDVPGWPGHSAGQHGDERARNSPGPDRHGEQMAGVRAFLASDDGAYITGQTIFVDGGLTLTPTSASRGRLSERRLDDHVFVLQASEPTQSSKV